jgi:hypothetical protein
MKNKPELVHHLAEILTRNPPTTKYECLTARLRGSTGDNVRRL